MAVEARITGNGSYAGSSSALVDYNATEDATPLDPALNQGGVGQLNFNVVDNPAGGAGTLSLLSDTVTLTDGSNGTTVGTVGGITVTDGIANVTADSRLGLLLATRRAQPMNASPGSIFRYYLSLAGITTNIVVEDGLDTASPVPVQGWTGVIWDNMRQFAVATSVEVALVSNNVVIRKLRKREAVNKRNITEQINVRKGQLAQNVEINYYNNRYGSGQAYPQGGTWREDVQVYQVDVGEILEINAPINASLLSITQPTCVSFVGRYQTGSVYSVVGADGLPIPPAQWTENGGKLVVSIGEDTKSLDIVITGANTTQGPYRIAVASGPSDVYSSLRLTGTGTFFEIQTITIPTGASANETAQVVGTTVDSPFISTLDQAYSKGLITAASYGSFEQTLSVTTVGINRSEVTGSTAYPTFNQFNAGGLQYNGVVSPAWSGKTMNEFNAAWSGKTFNDFNKYYYDLVRNNFSNQAFGNVAGARVKARDAYYRIDTADISATQVSYTAKLNTTFDDFNTVWKRAPWDASSVTFTFNDFEGVNKNRTFNDFNMTPLWRTYAAPLK